MRTREPSHHRNKAAGFTLPVVLVVICALLILAVGVLLVAGVERRTARSFADRQRAELAARAGLEDIRGILKLEASNDEYVVLQSTPEHPTTKGFEPSPRIFLARGKSSGGAYSYRYVPLFSTSSLPADTSRLVSPRIEPLLGAEAHEWIDFTAVPYADKVRASWLPIQDEKGRNVARYAYWVEDLQAKLDPKTVGNDKGNSGIHVRAGWPFPAAGLNDRPLSDDEPSLDQVALYAVDPSVTEARQGTIGQQVMKNRAMLVSPDSALAAAGVAPPLARLKSEDASTNGKIGELVDVRSRAIEKSLAPGLRSYLEQPVVPFVDGIDPAAAGKAKLNLNKLLSASGDAAVQEMSDFIKQAMPRFEQRKGGFPEDYLETLSANALDYADADSEPRITVGSYRGLDSYPLVSEFLMRFRWEDVLEEGGRKYLVLSASTYVELWNMTDKQIAGNAEVSFETAYKFPLGANPEVTLADMANASPQLTESEGYRWFPPIAIALEPNEYRVIKCGTLTYKIDAGPSSVFIPSPLVLEGETFGSSKAGYRLKWNGVIVDQSRGGIHRNNSSLNYPSDTASQPRQRTRTTIPSHTHTRSGSYKNNMGDPRMSFYNHAPQDANVYPDNYSPNRRNVRWGTIYKEDGDSKSKVHGRIMPSEWPDGGHNSTYESNAFYTTNERVMPDDARFMPPAESVLRKPPVEEAPARISNLGRFYSATELGRAYDPVMWENAMPAGANLPWGDVESTSNSSTDFGGGNTLRIGRPEHPRFDAAGSPGLEAYHLLDLFHAGISRSDNPRERDGGVIRIEGHVNLNTASRDALRALAVGAMTMDPKISCRTSEDHETTGLMAPPVKPYKLTGSEINAEANRIADAIISARKTNPFAAPSAIAEVIDSDGKPVFGNKKQLPNGTKVHWTDSAAEESFARVYEASTVRSRNFRIWVVGQALAPTSATNAKPEVLAEVRRVFTVFADPGERAADGTIDASKTKLTILHENDF